MANLNKKQDYDYIQKGANLISANASVLWHIPSLHTRTKNLKFYKKWAIETSILKNVMETKISARIDLKRKVAFITSDIMKNYEALLDFITQRELQTEASTASVLLQPASGGKRLGRSHVWCPTSKFTEKKKKGRKKGHAKMKFRLKQSMRSCILKKKLDLNLSARRSWSNVASFTSGISPLTRGVCCKYNKSMSTYVSKHYPEATGNPKSQIMILFVLTVTNHQIAKVHDKKYATISIQ